MSAHNLFKLILILAKDLSPCPLGILNDVNKLITDKHYLLGPLPERAKPNIPDTLDLSEVKKLSGVRKKGHPATAILG